MTGNLACGRRPSALLSTPGGMISVPVQGGRGVTILIPFPPDVDIAGTPLYKVNDTGFTHDIPFRGHKAMADRLSQVSGHLTNTYGRGLLAGEVAIIT